VRRIAKFGPELFEDLSLCNDLPKTLVEGVTEGKKYERLMHKMEVVRYVDE
jgi:hypothetical protein